METTFRLMAIDTAREKTRLADALEAARETCEHCRPLNLITCTTRCDIWKLKNELKRLCEKLENTNFTIALLNTLKNKRRTQILATLSKGRFSIIKLQQNLKKLGYYHSHRTIDEEYIIPLKEAELIEEKKEKFQATLFGYKINELLQNFSGFLELLPPHSECYEETAIKALSENPKTYEELKTVVPIQSLSRVLKRLQGANLITKDNENSYIFYFKTKRNPEQERLSPTEKRVYENIPEEGTTAQKLSDKTNISMRRTYKYLRKLRGKKLTFKRKTPKKYALTEKGTQMAKFLDKLQALLKEFAQAKSEITTTNSEKIYEISAPDISKDQKRKPVQIPLLHNS